MFYDEYGRLRMNEHRNPRVVATTFAEWQNRINPQTSAAPTSGAPTSAAPTSGGTTDSSQGAAAGGGPDGGDAKDNADRNMSLPEYDNAKDWVDAVMGTPSIVSPGMIADGIMGRGMFDQNQDRSYSTRNGDFINNGLNPNMSDDEAAAAAASESDDPNAEFGEGNPSGPSIPGDIPAGATDRGAGDPDGIGYAEGGGVFNSSEQVPGPVVGPGGPTEDAVDANLSNGEFVSTTAATQTFGEDFLTQLNDIAKAPEAQGLMSNPAFEQSKQEFIQKVSGMMAPQQGMMASTQVQQGTTQAPPGSPTPMQPERPPGFAEGGAVSVSPSNGGSLMAPDSDFFDWLMDKFHSMTSKSKKAADFSASTGNPKAAEDAIKNTMSGMADTAMDNTNAMRAVNPTKPEQDELQSMAARSGKPPENPLKGFMAKPAIDQYEGVWTPSTEEELGKAKKMDLEDGKFSKSTPVEMDKAKKMDLEDGKMSKATPSELEKARKGMGGLKDAKNAPPKAPPSLMADPAAKVAGPTAMPDEAMTDAVAKKVLIGLMARIAPGVGVAAGMAPGATNEGEDEDLAEALKDPQAAMGNVKEQRNKDDKSGLMAPSSDTNFEEEKALFESSKKLKDSKKPGLKIDIKPKTKAMDKSSTKKTSSEDNKLAPGASLGDALAFYKSKGASTFEWDGDTYVKSNSPSGYTIKN